MSQFEVHDPTVLAHARALIEHTNPAGAAQEVLHAVTHNEEWRGKRCLNLLAPEAPTSPTVRRLLSAEIGTPEVPFRRAAEGHIGRVNRWSGRSTLTRSDGSTLPRPLRRTAQTGSTLPQSLPVQLRPL